MSICLCVWLYVCPSVPVSISMYVHLYVCPSLRVSISTCVHLYVCVSVWPIFVHPSNPTAHQLKKTQLQTSNYPMSYKFYRKNTRNTNEEQQKMPNLKHNICHRCKFSHIYSIEMSKRHTNKTRDMVIFLSEENIAINVFASPSLFLHTYVMHSCKQGNQMIHGCRAIISLFIGLVVYFFLETFKDMGFDILCFLFFLQTMTSLFWGLTHS